MKKKLALMMAFILVLMASLTGCGSESDRTDENVTAVSEGTPAFGGEITLGITNDLDSLDPHKATAAGTNEVLFNIFEGLVKPDENGNLVPAIAESYEMSDDGMHYTFVIRQGIKFHNGKDLTVDDVVYSINRVSGLDGSPDSEVNHVSALSTLTSVDTSVNEDGKDVVTLNLSEPNTELLGFLTFAIIPCDYDGQSTFPIGTGPFKFVSYTPLTSFVIEKNNDYYGTKAYLDKVTFKICADTDAAFTQLLAGSIDIFPYLTSDQADQLGNGYNILVGSMNLVQALFLNNKVKPFDDVRVRQAVCYATDRQGILDMVAGGRGTLIGSGMFAGFGKYFNADCTDVYTANTDKAKELLKEAGYPDGFDMTITVPSNYQFHVDTAQVLVEQLKQVGINADIELVEWSSWLDDVYYGRKFQSTVIGIDADLAPSDVMERYVSDSDKNFINFNSPDFDTLYAKAVAECDDSKKVEDYKELQNILTKNAASDYIEDPALIVAVNKKLSGYTFYPVYVQDMSKVYYISQ